MREADNPMHVDMDKCDFYVHVHDLPLNMMNLGVATLLGNKIGIFRDMEMDAAGCSWGASLRIRVGVNVTQPLKRALKIRSTSGEELLARLTYERLPNFCYLCGLLGHIDKYCELRFDDNFHDPGGETPYGPWLRAPIPTRGRQQMLSQTGRWAFPQYHQRKPAPAYPRQRDDNTIDAPSSQTRERRQAVHDRGKAKCGDSNHSDEDQASSAIGDTSRPGARVGVVDRLDVGLGGGAINVLGVSNCWNRTRLGFIQAPPPKLGFSLRNQVSTEERGYRRFTGFYSNPDTVRRKVSWALLQKLARISVRPWLCGGDFNEILSQAEKQGSLPRANWQIEEFRACLRDCRLLDLGFEGNIFTWSNHREFPNTIRARLDRAVSDSRWAHLFPTATVSHEEVDCSDHAAVWVHLRPEHNCSRKQRWFRFEAALWLGGPKRLDNGHRL
ncbi:UNVERIFIED_CONTAM: hypothetical protein Slati_2639000 [Sesamum latifolium]|uniref:CCHC-type domain-containing protein n=1 Tax=Sesamum latifolium TaxID=2727402 RepID=A0AAW2VU47_9LAMI